MTRNRVGISRLAATAALLVAALGCEADGSKSPGQQLASPVTPIASQHVSISSSRQTLTVGRDDVFAQLTVQALAPDFAPLPNGTDVVLTTNLGAFDSPSGGQTLTLDLVGGQATARFYPGGTEGNARVVATVNGIAASVTINIRPDPTGGVPPEPAPVESVLTLTANPSVLSEEAAESDAFPTEVLITATVIGSDGDPFKNAGVYFTTPLGTFSNDSTTSDIFKTDGSGQIVESLSIVDSDLLAFPSGTFQVTGHLGVEGGEKTVAVTITILAGPAPPVPAQVLLAAGVTFVNDGANPDPIALTATVLDQNGDPIEGVNVTFTSTLGSPSPTVVETIVGGIAASVLDLNQLDVDNHGSNSFTVSAKVTTASGTVNSAPVVITIVRGDDPVATSISVSAVPPTVDDDGINDGGAGEAVVVNAVVRDQNGALMNGVTVEFTTELGVFTAISANTNPSGVASSTLNITSGQLAGFPSDNFDVTGTIGVSGGTASDSATVTILRTFPLAANFSFVLDAGDGSDVDFTDLSSGSPSSWEWDFGNNGSVDTMVQSPTDQDLLALLGSGTHEIKLTVFKNGSSSSQIKEIIIP